MNMYKARQGDIIWLNFCPQSGHEQKGRRPALVISNNDFNDFMKCAAMVCPITSNVKPIPLQVELDERTKTKGVIMCNQAKILDISERNAKFIENLPIDLLKEVSDIVSGFVECA